MSYRKWVILKAAAIVLFGVAASSWGASPATQTINVTASVKTACAISASSNLAFGQYDPLAGSPTGNGSITFNCTKGSSGVTVDVSTGGAFGSGIAGKRSMAGGGDFLSYDLYKPDVVGAGGVTTATLLGSGIAGGSTFAVPSTAFTTGATAVLLKIFGQIPAAQDVTGSVAGVSYSDTVTVGVYF
jgi:spore coat protein U-like protein